MGNEIVSMNLMGFTSPVMDVIEKGFVKFYQTAKDNRQEYYLPTVLEQLKSLTVDIPVLRSGDQWFGVTYREDKAAVQSSLSELVAKGNYPTDLWI